MNRFKNYSLLKVLLFIVLDNLTLVKNQTHNKVFFVDRETINYRDVLYKPKISDFNEVTRYEASVRNLKIYVYPDRIKLVNSIHKFWHGWNCTDFFICEIAEAIEAVSDITGVSWMDSTVKKLEWGVNVKLDPKPIINSFLSYKFKPFFAMVDKGDMYGVFCEYDEYLLKAYDKQYESWKNGSVRTEPLLRWEIGAKEKYLNRMLGVPPVLNTVTEMSNLRKLADHSVNLFRSSIRNKTMNLHKLSVTQKKIIAAMRNDEIREDMKIHNPDSYKKDLRTYRQIMADKEVCISDMRESDIEEKFDELLYGIPACTTGRKWGNQVA